MLGFIFFAHKKDVNFVQMSPGGQSRWKHVEWVPSG